MTFIQFIVNGEKKCSGRTIGGCVSDRQKTKEDPVGLNERVDYDYGKQVLISGKEFKGILAWADSTLTMDEILSYESTGKADERITDYGNRLANSALSYVDRVASTILERIPQTERDVCRPAIFQKSLVSIGMIVYDRSELHQEIRLPRMVWDNSVGAFKFEYEDHWHAELGHPIARQRGSSYVDEKVNEVLRQLHHYHQQNNTVDSDVPLNKKNLNKIGTLYLLAGAYHTALECPAVGGQPDFSTLERESIDNNFVGEEGYALVNLVSHWEKAIILPSEYRKGYKWIFDQIGMIGKHQATLQDYEKMADATFMTVYDFLTSCKKPHELDRKIDLCAKEISQNRNGQS